MLEHTEAAKRFYKSKRWQNKREAVLRRDEYECRECRRYGKTTPAVMVHHIFPFESHPEHKLNHHNLISLCNKCHERMHVRFTNELTDDGMKWQERVRKNLEPPHFENLKNPARGPEEGNLFQ